MLYHQDRDALMEFGNESDERAREAEARVRDLEGEIGRMSEELQICKRETEIDQVRNFLRKRKLVLLSALTDLSLIAFPQKG